MKQQPRAQQLKTLTAITSSTTSPQRFDCRARIMQAAFGACGSCGVWRSYQPCAHPYCLYRTAAPKAGKPLLFPVWIFNFGRHSRFASGHGPGAPRSFMTLETSALATSSRPCTCRCCWPPLLRPESTQPALSVTGKLPSPLATPLPEPPAASTKRERPDVHPTPRHRSDRLWRAGRP